MTEYMKLAVDLANENVKEGGTPYGSVLVKDGKVIAQGVNTTHRDHDVSGHAELNAIRDAQKMLGRIDLSDCVIYASGHPCPMCFSAIALSGIKHIIFGTSVQDAADVGMSYTQDIYNYLGGDKQALDLVIEQEVIADEAINPTQVFKRHRKL